MTRGWAIVALAGTLVFHGGCGTEDGSGTSSGGHGGDAGLTGTGPGGPGSGSGSCGAVRVGAARVTPRVVLIVDQSGSMQRTFVARDGTTDTRWNLVRDSLIGPQGIVTELEGAVDFGLSLYTALETDAMPNVPIPGTPCPLISAVPVAPENHDDISSMYLMEEPRDETPTGDAISAILDDFLNRVDPEDSGPTIFVLATDGMPDRCEQLNNKGVPADQAELNNLIARQESVDAITRAFDNGVRTYVMSVGSETVAVEHLQELANAGTGVGPNDPGAPYWTAGDQQGLEEALRTIVGGSLSCDIELDSPIEVSAACRGSVELNGRALPCDDPDGWHVLDAETIQLTGEACDQLKQFPTALVTAEFPCQVILI